MKQSLVFVLCAGILYPQIAFSQERSLKVLPRGNIVGASATLIDTMGSGLIKLVKTPQPQKEKAFKEKALDEIRYISTPAQRKALKKLNSEEEITTFLKDFWQKLDPTPGTPENEVKDEYDRRWAYANEHFTCHQEGWKTDRGRVYIIYGPPDGIDYIPWAYTGVALEAWLYNRPASGIETPNIFSNYHSGMTKFIFADFTRSGLFTQFYSSERGEQSDSRVFNTALSGIEQ